MYTAKDVRGLVAMIGTPATPDASDWRSQNTVDLDETAKLVDKLINDGVGAISCTGTTGECATLLDHEIQAFADCVVQTARRRVPVFVGGTGLGTRATINRLKLITDAGAEATMLGVPMWQTPATEVAVQFYADIYEAFPNLSIMVYENHQAFKFDFSANFWRQVHKKNPNIIAAKSGELTSYLAKLEATNWGDVNFVPMERGAYAFARLSPETTTATWSTGAPMGPEPSLALVDALNARDWPLAKQITDDLAWASTHNPGPVEFAKYNLQLERGRSRYSDYYNPGPNRPPYHTPLPAHLEEGAKESAKRWGELRKKYARTPVAQ